MMRENDPSSPNSSSRGSRVRGGGGGGSTTVKPSLSSSSHSGRSTTRQQRQRSSSSLSSPAARCLFLQKYILFLLFPSLLTTWKMISTDFDQFVEKSWSSLDGEDRSFLPPPVKNNRKSAHAPLVARQRIPDSSTHSETLVADDGHVVWDDAFYRRWKEDSRKATTFSDADNNNYKYDDEWYARRIQNATAVIAYATTITGGCEENNLKHGGGGKSFIDLAAVLAHSIHLSSIRNPNSTSTFDYKLYAFLHPDAALKSSTNGTSSSSSWCADQMRALGYIVQIRETPINVTNIASPSYRKRLISPYSGCCGEKEFLKLYSYTLTEHPIVVHVDLDTMILQPLDEFYHAMLAPDTGVDRYIPHAQWPEERHLDATNNDKRVKAMFTRDYPMLPIIDTATRRPEKVGVQGGFLMMRPNTTVFDELCQMILQGHFESGWYEEDPQRPGKKLVAYPGFYGAAQVQGLLGFYYGHVHGNQMSVELNRCRVNNMVDNPRTKKRNEKKSVCITGQADDQCQDCRLMNVSDVYTAHFTFCSKPSHCGLAMNSAQPLCYALHSKWHAIRYDLETVLTGTAAPIDHLGPKHRDFFGHCQNHNMYTTVDWLNLTTTMEKKQRSIGTTHDDSKG